jgi:hypothetical protein
LSLRALIEHQGVFGPSEKELEKDRIEMQGMSEVLFFFCSSSSKDIFLSQFLVPPSTARKVKLSFVEGDQQGD